MNRDQGDHRIRDRLRAAPSRGSWIGALLLWWPSLRPTLLPRAPMIQGDVSATRGKVAFGFLHTMGAEAVPGLLRAFRADHPGVRFSLVQDSAVAMLARMRAGELDLCLTSPLPDDPDLSVRGLDEQRLYLVVPADHRLAAGRLSHLTARRRAARRARPRPRPPRRRSGSATRWLARGPGLAPP